MPYRSTPIQKRIINLYNYLDLGSPLNKWHTNDLSINWLECQHKPSNIMFSRENKGILYTI